MKPSTPPSFLDPTLLEPRDPKTLNCVALSKRFGSSKSFLVQLDRFLCFPFLWPMASPIEELETQKARAKKRLAEIRDEIRNAGKRARRFEEGTHLAVTLYEAGVQGTFPKLGAQQQAALLMLFELSDLCADVVVSYALGQGREAKHKCTEFDE